MNQILSHAHEHGSPKRYVLIIPQLPNSHVWLLDLLVFSRMVDTATNDQQIHTTFLQLCNSSKILRFKPAPSPLAGFRLSVDSERKKYSLTTYLR